MNRKRTAVTLLCCALFLGADYAAFGKEIDRQALFRHIHETFNTPADLKFALKDLKPAAIAGLMVGRLELGDGQQVQTIHISNDGRFYFLSSAFKLGPSPIPGLKTLVTGPNVIPPLGVYISEDGRHLLFGNAMDLSIDPDADNRKKINLKGATSWGPIKAPVVLVEYSDLQCPHCKLAHETLGKEIESAYKNKVRWVFKNYPLTNLHLWSYQAALAEACAAIIKPEAAREFQASFFRDQASIRKETVREKSLEFAKKNAINASRFERCLDTQESKPSVESDIAEGNALEVTATPTLFINGRRSRTNTFPEIRAVIEEMLRAQH